MIASLLPSIIGYGLSQDDKDQELQLKKDALAQLAGVDLPTIEQQQIHLQDLVSQGVLSPEALELIQQQDSALKDVKTDPRLKDMQMNALMRLSQQGNEGFTASDRAALNQTRRSVEQDVNARNQSILQGMQQRGMGGSGAELAMQLSNSQAGADRAAQEGDRTAAMAQKNALEAAISSGQLGGSIRSQDYSELANAAQAQDAINRFNSANAQQVAQYNVGGRNDARRYNLGEAQRIADANVGNRNKEEMHNTGLYQQDFENRWRKAGGQASGMNTLAGQYGSNARDTAQFGSTIGQAIGQAESTAASFLSGGMPMPSGGGMGRSAAPNNYDVEMAKAHRAPGYAHGGIVNYNEGGNVHKKPQPKNDIDELDPKKAKEFVEGFNKSGWDKVKENWEGAKKQLGFAHGGEIESPKLFSLLNNGPNVPGKAEIEGDSEENDKVHALLSPGEGVIPRSIMDSSDAAILAFVKLMKTKKGDK